MTLPMLTRKVVEVKLSEETTNNGHYLIKFAQEVLVRCEGEDDFIHTGDLFNQDETSRFTNTYKNRLLTNGFASYVYRNPKIEQRKELFFIVTDDGELGAFDSRERCQFEINKGILQ